MVTFIKQFKDITLNDIALVGGKNASLGELIIHLTPRGINVPDGFAVTADAFRTFIEYNQLQLPLQTVMQQLDKQSFSNLKETGSEARQLFLKGKLPPAIAQAIVEAYHHLSGASQIEVAVRSSATAEDLPSASFAGQHESYLNIRGEQALLNAVQQCFASLYTDRAIKYRIDKDFAHHSVLLSVGVQKMVRSDMACSGIGFTLDPESGFRELIHISGVWGLGENIVQGTVTPDEYFVFKPTLLKGKKAIIQKRLGEKAKTMIYDESENSTIINTDTPLAKRDQFVLTDNEVHKLAKWAYKIEEHYQRPMDIEWAKDGLTNELFITQARPETVHSQADHQQIIEFKLNGKGKTVIEGVAIGSKIATGTARVLKSTNESDRLKDGDIVVTDITSPDWDPVLKKTAAIITNKGGRTSHASIVARELGVPAIVGTGNATDKIKDGDLITVSCSEGKTGFVYAGKIPFETKIIDLSSVTMPKTTDVMMIVGDPEKAFKLSFYPNDGVGLMRLEFIIANSIQIHPMALVKFNELKDENVKERIETLTHNYADKESYFIEKLTESIATIAAAFYPKEVIVRTSDFKTNEYANLIGGVDFEPKEENPMIGFRGASRYYSDLYKEGFRLECKALKMVREEMGLENVKIMIPFCRTAEEGEKVVALMQSFGLKRNENRLKIYVMAEIPSNVLDAENFARVFDGFSIGSNDLTQLVLGIDRDTALIAPLFNEQHPAVKQMITMAIDKANALGKKIGLCGQAPSDYPEFTRFLVERGISSISFNPDALLTGIKNINNAEAELMLQNNN
ncbi:phosphoenolpyruvate synthase [Solitalea canadensis]|uniref:Phosphoenolpyruvate synthase n=1 Tax=Solitalea canadensis (strain ATCC 29591 / DSM 3403 / JCM 21819 / LMG 8368 / NBRC 15130 / NCIMB 12057 / USAM 9D) TaxID=929556 RepID=H8KQD0_SOLCM|nr:phosphoenolpyruvate synthase [Solitalea canadensis]AFD06546.1 phosphoenolpyruvate synthase [Solitalea canadensis DSM 3403]